MNHTRRETDFIREVENLENVVFVCFGHSEERDFLPQIGDEENVIIDIMQHLSGAPHGQIEAELNHQIDPSYSA